MRSRSSRSPDKSGIMEIHFSRKRDAKRAKSSPRFEIVRMLVRFDHVASFIMNADHCIM